MSEEIQNQFKTDWEALLSRFWAPIEGANRYKAKLKGELTTNLIREYISKVLCEKSLPFAVSENNVYIEGYSCEFDLLILKNWTEPVFTEPYIYRPADVVAVVECKASGIWLNSNVPYKNMFEKELNAVADMRSNGFPVNFGYVTAKEVRNKSKNTSIQFAFPQMWIDETLNEKGLGEKSVYCFFEAKSGEKVIPWEHNNVAFAEFVETICTTK